MPSPFPGMDPYLEGRWSDVHSKLIAFIGEAVQARLPADLRARSEERVLLEADEDDAPLAAYRPDVAVVERPTGGGAAMAQADVDVEPVEVLDVYEPWIDRSVHIIDRTNGNRVVTVIEVLSPWNKTPGRLNDAYVRKARDYARAGTSLVEIDLLRSVRSHLPVTDDALPPGRRGAYRIVVQRAWQPDRHAVYPIGLRRRLPRVPVPLREHDAEVALDLQPLIDRVYAAGGHDDIDYARPPEPPLSADDAAWADGLLREAGIGGR